MPEEETLDAHEWQNANECAIISRRRQIQALMFEYPLHDRAPASEMKVRPVGLAADKGIPARCWALIERDVQRQARAAMALGA